MATFSPFTIARVLTPTIAAAGIASTAYVGHGMARGDLTPKIRLWLEHFFTGPGRLSRILLLFFILTNLKNMSFAWTFRVIGAMFRHATVKRKPLPKHKLFQYCITQSRNTILDTDYNMHKSNSTYFADLDVARTHMVMRLFAPGMEEVGHNPKAGLVRDKNNRVVKGTPGLALGAVSCHFKKEIPLFGRYEMWTRLLCWDRKWFYIVTHFVTPGKLKPGKDGKAVDPAELQKHVVATAISKYVFKMGRFTVHPSIVFDASGMLPQRPGGWRGGSDESGSDDELPNDAGLGSASSEWNWERVEAERRQGMEIARHFGALDEMHNLFDGGKNGNLGTFSPA